MSYQNIQVTNTPTKYSSWPGIVQLANGTIILSYRTSDTPTHTYDSTGRMVMRKSTDNGLTWSSETVVSKYWTDVDNRSGNIGVFNVNGVETLFQTVDMISSGVSDHDTYFTTSIDEGNTWSTPVFMQTGRCTVGKPIQLSDGSVVVPTYKVTNNDYTQYLYKSSDLVNWEEILANHSAPDYLNESAIIETSPGNVIMICRFDNEGATNYKLFKSTDYAETWDNGTLMGFGRYKPDRPSLTKIGPNTILFTRQNSLFWNDWSISQDGGIDWTTNLYLWRNGVQGFGGSYPESILLQNGQIITASATNGATSDIWIGIFDSADLTSRLPYNHLKLNHQKIVTQNPL